MNERQILQVFSKLDIAYARTDPEWVVGECPLAPYKLEHPKGTDTNPGFGVRIEEDDVSHYNCFTCKSTGTLGGLAMQLSKYREEPELMQYGKELDRQDILGGGMDYEWQEDSAPAASTAQIRNTNFPSEREFEDKYPSVLAIPDALRYLRGRQISLGTIVGLGLRFDPRQRRVMFPVYDYWTGRYAGCSGRSILSADTRDAIEQRTGKPQPKVRDYFGLQKDALLLHGRNVRHNGGRWAADDRRRILRYAASSAPYVLLVEGLFAFARIWQLGYAANGFAILGSKLLPGKAKIIEDVGKPVFWFTDDDPAGLACLYGKWLTDTERYAGGGALDMLYHSVAQFVPSWPEGKDDPDQLTGYEIDRMIEEAELYAKA